MGLQACKATFNALSRNNKERKKNPRTKATPIPGLVGKKKRKDENKGIGSGVGGDFGLENASHRCHCQAKSMYTAEEPTPTAHAPQWRRGAVAKPLPLTSSNSLKRHRMSWSPEGRGSNHVIYNTSRPLVIIGDVTSLLVTWSRFSTSWSCSARLYFELSRLLLLMKYGSAQFLCVLHFSKKKSFAMEDSRMSTSYFYLQAVLWRESRLRILWSSAETSLCDVIIMNNEYLPPALVVG